MELLIDYDSITNKIIDEIMEAKNNIVIITTAGKQLINLLKQKIKITNNIKIIIYIDFKIKIYTDFFKLAFINYKYNVKILPYAKYNEYNNINYINIDNNNILFTSYNFNIFKNDVMLCIKNNNKYNITNINIPVNNKYYYLSKPYFSNVNTDILNFIQRAQNNVIIITSKIENFYKNFSLLEKLHLIAQQLKIIIITNNNANNNANLNMFPNLQIKISKKYINFNAIIVDNIDILFTSANINLFNYYIFNINIKIYNNILFANKIKNFILPSYK